MKLFSLFYPKISDPLLDEDSSLRHICIVLGDHICFKHIIVCCDFCVLSIDISEVVFVTSLMDSQVTKCMLNELENYQILSKKYLSYEKYDVHHADCVDY
jgi:hypothetical protein